MASNWNGNWGQYSNPQADELIAAIPSETDPAKLKEIYTELVKIYLTNVPSFTLMYRPQSFHTVNESVWNSFLYDGDGTCAAGSSVEPDRRLEHLRVSTT
jgi:peptide/nickel transport system substrate-binding protein